MFTTEDYLQNHFILNSETEHTQYVPPQVKTLEMFFSCEVNIRKLFFFFLNTDLSILIYKTLCCVPKMVSELLSASETLLHVRCLFPL